jgi:hypothetical protein
MKRLTLVCLLSVLSVLCLSAQAPTTWTGYTGDQTRVTLSPGSAVAGSAAWCDLPYVGPAGYRSVGMTITAGSTCSFPTIELLDAQTYANYAWPYWKIIGSTTAIGLLSGGIGLRGLYWSECDIPSSYPYNLNAAQIFISDLEVYPCQY